MKRFDRIGLFLILVFAFAVRLFRLGASSLWYDETVSLYLARQDLVSLTQHTAGDIHPPLYYYLLHFWGQFAGWSEFSAAFLSLFFGILLTTLVYRVAHEWFDKRVALIATFLVAISPYNLWYSQEVRMYTLGAMLGLASTYFFVRLFRSGQRSAVSGRSLRNLIAYAVLSALGLYTLYYFVFLLAFQNLVALIWFLRNTQYTIHKLRIWLLSQLLTFILFLPWFPIAVRQSVDPPVPPWRSFIALPNVLLESFSALAFGQSIDPMMLLPALFVVAVVIAFAFTYRRKLTTDHRPQATFLFAYTFIPLAFIYGLSLWKPLYHVRYIFVYSPAFYILLALGLNRILNYELRITNYTLRIPRVLFFLLLALYFSLCTFSSYNFWFNSQYAKDDLRGAVHRLAEQWRPGDAILINAGYTYTAFDYYFDQPIAWRGRLSDYQKQDATNGAVVLQTGSIGASKNLGWTSPESDFYATTTDETRASLDRVFANHPRVWMLRIYDTVVDPDGVVRDYLATRGRIIDDQGFAGESFARVQGYLTSRAPLTTIPSNATRRGVLFGNRIVLRAFTPATTTARAGTPIDLTIYWQANESTNIDEHLFIGLFAEDGKMITSSDELPLGNALGTSRWTSDEILREPIRIFVPTNTPAGNYVLRVSMYNPLTQETLDAPSGEWIVENSQVVLTQVRVEK